MDPVVPTSFIPKKPLVENRGGTGLLMLIAVLIFVVSLLAAGGAFLYGQYLNRAIADKDSSLKKAEGAFDTSSIRDLERLDIRLSEGRTLIQNHLAPSGVFTFLSASTLERVQFTSMTLDIAPDGNAKLGLTGVADSFSSLALQSDQFSAAKVLRDVVFSDIATNATGHVTFTVTADIDPSLLSYARQNGAGVSDASAPGPTATQ
jgi:hypothetical protein